MNTIKSNSQPNSTSNASQDSEPAQQDGIKPELRMMVVFSPFSICEMYDIYEEHFYVPGTTFASSKFAGILVKQYPENGDDMVQEKLGKKGYDKIFFVDCSDIKPKHFFDSTYYLTPETSFNFFLRELKSHLVRLLLQPNGYPNGANIHLTVCAYHPMEALMFATQKFFKNSIADADEYKDFVNYVLDKNRRGGGGRFIKHIENWLDLYKWTIDVEYCSIYVGHQLVTTDPYHAEINRLKGLIEDVKEWDKKVVKEQNEAEIAKLEKEVNQLEYLMVGHYSGSNDSAIWERTDHYKKGIDVPGYCNKRAVMAIYDDKWYTQRELWSELRKLENGETDPDKIREWCDEQEKDLKKKKKEQYDPKIAEIETKIQILKARRNNAFEAQVLKDTYSDAYLGPNEINLSHIEYQGRYVDYDKLVLERNKLLTRYNREKQEIKDSRKIADKLELQKKDSIISTCLAIASTVWAPLALLDVGFEIYKMIRDDDGLAEHAISLGLDAIALIPVMGGVMRLSAKGMGAGAGAAKTVKVTKGKKFKVTTSKQGAGVMKYSKKAKASSDLSYVKSYANSDIGIINSSIVRTLKNSAMELKGGGYKEAFVPKVYNMLEDIKNVKGFRRTSYILADSAADTYTRWSILENGFMFVNGELDNMSLEEFWAEVAK